MRDSLQSFIQCLRRADSSLSAGVGFGPGVEEMADMLWLAEHLPGPTVNVSDVQKKGEQDSTQVDKASALNKKNSLNTSKTDQKTSSNK
ncbi:MAG: hypothetical protein ABG776_20865, partial [Cyanobacteria bacterium J06555_13]